MPSLPIRALRGPVPLLAAAALVLVAAGVVPLSDRTGERASVAAGQPPVDAPAPTNPDAGGPEPDPVAMTTSAPPQRQVPSTAATRTPRTSVPPPPPVPMRAERTPQTTFARPLQLDPPNAPTAPRPEPPAATTSRRGLTVWSWAPGLYAKPAAADAMAAVRALGADHVTLVQTSYVRDARASTVAPDPGRSPTDADIDAAVAAAKAAGLAIVLKPHVDIADGSWRGTISPTDRPAFWHSYRTMLLRSAELAERHGAALFVIGTELRGLEHDTLAWRSLAADVRTRYRGRITYDANFDDVDGVGFWDAVDEIGVSGYYPLSERPTTDVVALTAAWNRHLDGLGAVSARWQRPAYLAEVGYASFRGTTVTPWSARPSSVSSPEEQAAAYTSVLRAAAGRAWLGGLSFWAWRVTNEPAPGDFTPQGGPAVNAITGAWRS